MKIRRFEQDGIKEYEFNSYEDLKSWIDAQLEMYKKINGVRNEEKNRSFMSYKEQLEKHLDYFKCEKCEEKDHEGIF